MKQKLLRTISMILVVLAAFSTGIISKAGAEEQKYWINPNGGSKYHRMHHCPSIHSVTEISDGFVSDCEYSTIYCNSDSYAAEWAREKGITSVVYMDVEGISANYVLPANLTTISDGAFAGIQNGVFRIPGTVNEISPSAFEPTAVLVVLAGSSAEQAAQGLDVELIRERVAAD